MINTCQESKKLIKEMHRVYGNDGKPDELAAGLPSPHQSGGNGMYHCLNCQHIQGMKKIAVAKHPKKPGALQSACRRTEELLSEKEKLFHQSS
jgi:hypothetical protein